MKIHLFILLLISGLKSGQQGFMLENADKASIKFKLINNLIFVPMIVNGVELNFMLDSGISETLLFSLEDKNVDFRNVEKITFRGLGETVSVDALKSINNEIRIGKNFVDRSHTVFIVLDEDFNVSQDIGIPVNGIIGYYFFKNHPLEINYIIKPLQFTKTAQNCRKRSSNFRNFLSA